MLPVICISTPTLPPVGVTPKMLGTAQNAGVAPPPSVTLRLPRRTVTSPVRLSPRSCTVIWLSVTVSMSTVAPPMMTLDFALIGAEAAAIDGDHIVLAAPIGHDAVDRIDLRLHIGQRGQERTADADAARSDA